MRKFLLSLVILLTASVHAAPKGGKIRFPKIKATGLLEGRDLTGRVLWEGFWIGSDGGLAFTCGPESEPGYYDDSDARVLAKTLKRLFPKHRLGLYSDEINHSIYPNQGESREDLMKLVKERLEAAGAVVRPGGTQTLQD